MDSKRALDIHWLTRVDSVLELPIQAITVQLFPRAGAKFRDWRVFIHVKSNVLELGFDTSTNKIICAQLNYPTPASPGALVADARPRYVAPTVKRILEIATQFAQAVLYLTPELGAREVQSRWSSWVVQFMMEVVENSALFVPCREFYRMKELIDWNLDNE